MVCLPQAELDFWWEHWLYPDPNSELQILIS